MSRRSGLDRYSAAPGQRGTAPLVGIVLLVAVVVVLGTVIIVPVLGLAEQTPDSAPTVAFDAEQDGDAVSLRPVAGEQVDLSRVALSNGTATRPASAYTNASVLSAGVELTVDDDLLAGERLRVVYRGEADSYVLRTVDIADVAESGDPDPDRFEIPAAGQAQYDRLTGTDLAAGDPSTGGKDSVFGVELTGEAAGTPLDGPTQVQVTVTNHLGTQPFDAAPNNRLIGQTTVEFEDGVGSFTIGGANRSDADLTLGFLGFLPSVNDVETIEVALSNANGTITRRVVDLSPED